MYRIDRINWDLEFLILSILSIFARTDFDKMYRIDRIRSGCSFGFSSCQSCLYSLVQISTGCTGSVRIWGYSFPAPSRLTSSSPGRPKEYRTPVDDLGKNASPSDGVNRVLPVPT